MVALPVRWTSAPASSTRRSKAFGERQPRSDVRPEGETPMKKLIIATAAAVLLGAPLALAANTTTTTTTTPATTTKPATQHASLMQQCHSLGVQFDKAEPKHKTDKNFNDAMALRKEGKTLCVGH